jgi:hypothetical protein
MTIVGITGVPNKKPSCSGFKPVTDQDSRPVTDPWSVSDSVPRPDHVQNMSEPQVKQISNDPYTCKRELPIAPKLPEESCEERQSAYPKPSAIKKMNKLNQTSYVKTYEIQRPGEQGIL